MCFTLNQHGGHSPFSPLFPGPVPQNISLEPRKHDRHPSKCFVQFMKVSGPAPPSITRQQTGRPKAEKFPPKCYSQIVTETPRPWDRRSTETTKAYAAFLAYIALGFWCR